MAAKINFASHKIIFNVYYFKNTIRLDVDLAFLDFTEFKVKSYSTVYSKEFGINSLSLDSDLYLASNEVKAIFKKYNVNVVRRKKYLNINSEYFFFEDIVLPKLNATEGKKALALELERLYPNLDNLFYYDTIVSEMGQVQNYHVALISKHYYDQILAVIKPFKINFDNVSLASNALRRVLVKNNVFNKKRNTLFINIGKNYSTIVSYSDMIDNLTISSDCGYEDFLERIAKYLNLPLTAVYAGLDGGNDYHEEIFDDAMLEITEESLRELIDNIKRVIGSFCLDNLYDNVFINIEHGKLEFLKNNLCKLFKIESSSFRPVNNVDPNYLMDSGVVLSANALDYRFPKR